MRILITGAEGQLGRAVSNAFAGHQVTGLSRTELDVSERDAVRAQIREHRPHLVVHCAALTDTTACERDPDRADDVNGHGTGLVAAAAEEAGARVIAVSTNEVFDGEAHAPYDEDASPRPLNAYGRSKLLGEALAMGECERALLIVRTSWLYGEGGNNFVTKVLAAARAGRALRFVTDEVSTPTSVDDLAVALRGLIEQGAPAGTYHLTNEGEASRYDWSCEILRLAGLADVPVEPVTTNQLIESGYVGPAKPAYSVLANTRARAIGIVLRPWRDALVDYVAKSRVATDA